MTPLETVHAYIASAVSESGLTPRFLAALLGAERGSALLESWTANNNPADIAYDRLNDSWPLVPNQNVAPWYEGAVDVQPNRIVVYDSPEAGGQALGRLLKSPPDSMHLDGPVLLALNANPYQQCVLVCQSNYAASHYNATAIHPGGLLWAVYLDPLYRPLWVGVGAEQPSPVLPHEETPIRTGELGPTESYTVMPGDTLNGIAARYHTTVGILAAMNNLPDPNRIEAGQVIQVPRLSARYLVVTVRRGDTLWGIGQQYHVPWKVIAEENAVSDPAHLQVGQRLRIPLNE